MEEAKQGKVDTVGVNKLLAAYQQYSVDYPSDTLGAEYLFKAADFCRYLHDPMKSIELYALVYNKYPSLSKRPYALFLQGFIYENELKNLSAAREKYQQFLDTYPDLPFAKDVRITMNNLGKSPEELVKEFEEKQKADSAATAGKVK